MFRSLLYCFYCALLASQPLFAASFTPLGDLAGGAFASRAHAVSANGQVVVGRGTTASGTEAFRWTAQEGMVSLGYFPSSNVIGTANAVSADGSTIVGWSTAGENFEAFRWTAQEGMVSLGAFPAIGVYSHAHGVSADGSVIVGESETFIGTAGFRWTAEDGLVDLGHFPGGDPEFITVAYAVSADGSVIVGISTSDLSPNGARPFRWTADTGLENLTLLPHPGHARAVSADGNVIVGRMSDGLSSFAFRWTESEGMVSLGVLPGASLSTALGVSDDGTVVVGGSSGGAFLWTEASGMLNLQDYLSSNGVDIPEGWMLREATAISGDGRTIVGWGMNPDGSEEAWIAVIPEPSSFLLALCGLVALMRWGRRMRPR